MYPQESHAASGYDESPVSKYYPAGNGLADFGDDSDQMMYPSSPSPSHMYGSQRQAYAPHYDSNAHPTHGHDVYSYYDEPHDTHPASPAYAPALPTSSQGYPRNFQFTGTSLRQNAVSQPRQSPWLRGKQSQANEPPRQLQEDFSAHDNPYAETSYSHDPRHGRTTADDRSPHGIRLRPVSELPDVYRSLFKFGVFNAVQSSCFDDVVHGANNLVISAPTGSGKTVLFELAIIRMLKQPSAERQQFKCVYVSPTKALCSERFRDWSAKFEPMGIKCSELTGDTIHFGKGVWGDAKNASIMKDHGQTLSTIQLFLVDEVHILNENRGSTLEVIVSRMKRNGTNVRFVLVSATVPNIQDIANWIGNEQRSGPARVYEFGEDFRPCKLTRYVYGVHRGKGQNEFAFNKNLDYRLFPLLLKHSVGKPMLIFVSTRSGVLATGQHLLKCYVDAETKRENVPWTRPPRIDHVFHDQRLAELAAAGIGIHHAGLNLDDRRAIEDLYIKKILRLVTLAVGVNLPAHMVVIRGVQTFQNNMAVEYSDLDIMQMLGRAGRPQFDKDGIAIILCETELEDKYRALAQGQTVLESSLHSNLSEHLNSEIALGTITNLDSAKTWLRGSFLFQRIKQNPNYYSLGKEDDQTWEQRVDDLVMQSIERLQETQLVEYDAWNSRGGGGLASTDYGDIMSKFYIRQKTMELILALPERVSFRETMEMLAASEEFSDIKMRTSEKAPLNRLRQHNDIRYTIKKLDKAADKVFLLMQAILGGISLNSPDYKSVDSQPNLEALLIFRHVSRIARAIVETAIAKKQGAQIKAGLELLRCLSAKAWEDRPVVLRQIEQIGEKSLKVLAEHGVTTIDSLRSQDTLRIETLLNRRPPFGLDLINSLKEFPKYSLKLSEISVSTYRGAKPVEVCLTVHCGLDTEWSKPHKSKKLKAAGANMTSVLAISTDLDFIDYRRIPTSLLKEKKTFDLTAYLSKPSQSILVVISCVRLL
ncbi:hypothetical protein ONZ45_g16911 [Pleurotus djamor]|nr:hypothetical protein ONZ45_g16911 [Pleurotus djamor]